MGGGRGGGGVRGGGEGVWEGKGRGVLLRGNYIGDIQRCRMSLS